MIQESSFQTKNQTSKAKVVAAVRESIPKAYSTSKWLLSIMIPVSFGVLLLNYTGILALVSDYLKPAFEYMGLPGESAFVLLTSIFTNIYTAIAVITSLELEGRVVTILAAMCLVAHGFIIETAVLKKTGSSMLRMILLRLAGSFVLGLFLNWILPADSFQAHSSLFVQQETFNSMFKAWLWTSLVLSLKVIILITLLMILQRILEVFGVIKWLSRMLAPLQSIMGLPDSTSFSWIVANTLGLAYGSAIMIEQVEKGQMTKSEADLLNHHIAVSHSQLEDPLLFAAIGVPLGWLIIPRLFLGIIVVWLYRFELFIRKSLNSFIFKN
ncbi:nucleoside recognition domain-containing protein [Labilibaculum sp. K2S]|uniref:nucleoside recognition domain-containing protein n=1 Tax=Labilibaculum sp. K2S TaxID=3056386 RepID=UPI0025A35731|nr:nucleoside recognition domain-containing protein [Labilibaculum sp. K2S]MDM8159133.1 nucleoside recognition domain-containing protein [Labilibaculum sp. K2S]